ncbi:relaxase/mobilization nuclease domain-containing protein [Paenarthrobacter sp. YJN-5]|uniref:relaxase/mobilization nuclease domain-containing protein n=1 Tax=Paenarthrobacter sp. YJN-5 TaxID=2735316 RepID=UPI00187805EE|nr:relaxase/mobilization nuclease domain-containing protein [Paenarthrobacter sp. YJN-5]QOT19883.1 relaxase/mobilization nuclease domain-containing protein [Paenarthrobacter sp. YJN-5]
MIPNITKGERMAGLLVYLAGPGRANEHTDPHLVAGSAPIMAWHNDDQLNRDAALSIAHQLDQARNVLGVEVKGGHVWHCSLSLRADEGDLTDEKWAQIATDFMDEMGFTEASGKAPVAWVAIRHGHSKAGNDHIHIAASMAREDGTKWSSHLDYKRAQDTARALEKKHGLEELSPVYAMRGLRPGEREAAERRGRDEPERRSLARKIRACATAAADEAEFVRRVRRAGAMIKPRYAAGRDDVVVGYSVAERPPKGIRPVWFGGGHLAKDLTLPRLRGAWNDTPDTAATAVAEWGAAARGRRPVSMGREAHEPDPQLWERYSEEVARLREQLRAVPVDDHATWAQVARETSGAFAAWSTATEPTPGPLAAAADELSKTAQLRRYPARPVRTVGPSAKGASLMLMAATMGGRGTAAEAIMLRQLLNVAKAVHDMHKASNDLRRARQLSHVVKHQLAQVAAALPGIPTTTPAVDNEAAEAVRTGTAGQGPARPVGSVLPPSYEQARPHTSTRGGHTRPDHGR